MEPGSAPPLSAFTAAERRLIQRLRTPLAVQRFLNALAYNTEPPPGRATLRSFRGVVRHRTAHCLEAALSAAVILEQHGYPPLVLSFESIDQLDHVIFVYRRNGRWGSVARSRDPGLHGRKAGLRHATRARAQLCRPVRRLHRPRDRLRGGRSAHDSGTTTGGCPSRTSGRSSGCCSTIRTARSAARIVTSIGCASATSNTASRVGRKPVYYARTDRWTPIAPESLKAVSPGY